MRTDHRREGCRANGLSSEASWREGQHVLLSFCLMARSSSEQTCRSTRIEDFKTLGPAAPPPRPPQKPPSLTLFYGLHPGGLGGPGEARRAQKQKRGFAPNIQPAGQILGGRDGKPELLFFLAWQEALQAPRAALLCSFPPASDCSTNDSCGCIPFCSF